MGVDYNEIVSYLLSLGAPKKEIDACPQTSKALRALAQKYHGDLSNTEAVKKAAADKSSTARANLMAKRHAKFRPLNDDERRRFRRAFEYYDADRSGELDMQEFRNAMVDSGMMPLSFEVKELFKEADADGNGTVDFEEYCRFVQLYKAKQNCCEMIMEKLMDLISPEPVYMADPFAPFLAKMRKAGCNQTAIDAFKYNYLKLISKENLMIPEIDILPVDRLPELTELNVPEDPTLLKQTVMLKLNGGLGTGMGLQKAKSLLPLRGDDTFLDFIAKQTLAMRKRYGVELAFMLMNSFATSADTLAHLKKYRGLGVSGVPLEFQQNKAPKVRASDLSPASWAAEPEHEWCPPGHGDLYPAMLGSGTLDRLLKRGFRYMFVSNSDNLGATMDLKLLSWFAASGAPFAMEACARTQADSKGGHLARAAKGNGLLLRESAQCPKEDEGAFGDWTKHRFFNTNNLWVDLKALKATFEALPNKTLPLPVMKNSKTVDPRDATSHKVLQLETAMGAAVECFEGALAIVVPRERFAPVKVLLPLPRACRCFCASL